MFTKCKVAGATSLSCLCLLFALSANSFAQTNTDQKRALRKKVGVLLLRQADPFFLRLAQALREKSVPAQLDLEIVDAESSVAASSQDLTKQRTEQQEVQLHRFIMQGPDALILFPASDDNGIAFYTQTAHRAGIPIFALDACKTCGDSIVATVTTDNRLGGALAAEILVQRLPPSAEIVVLDAPGYETVGERVAGFDDYLLTRRTGTIWKYVVDGRRETAARVMRRALEEHPRVRGVFAINDDTALGAAEELQGRSDFKVVGFDGSQEARQEIDKGESAFCATIVQDADGLASALVRQILDYAPQSARQRSVVVSVNPYPDQASACK